MGLPALSADYLFVGPLLEQRLAAQVPDIPVQLCERAEQVLEADKRARVLMVMWAGDRFDESASGRSALLPAQLMRQRWLVALGLNNAGRTADARNASAGPVLAQVHYALAGWRPEGSPHALQRANAAMQPIFTGTKAIYPLGFEIQLSL